MAETLDTVGEKIAALTTSFGEVRQQLDGHDKRFDQIDKRLDQFDSRFEQVADGLAQVNHRVDEQGSSLRTLLQRMDAKLDLVLVRLTLMTERDPGP